MDYRKYSMSWKEKIIYGFLYSTVFLLLAKIFYDSYLAAIIGILFFPFLFRYQGTLLAQKRQQQLVLEFKEFILSFDASLKTGYSIENAFLEAYHDMKFLYGESQDIVCECHKIAIQLQNNKVLEDLLTDFAIRSGQNDIRDFAAIFAIAKRSGGNMAAMIHNTAHIISEKIEVKREIRLMFASKRMEQTIMNIVPIAIISYVRITTPDYFDRIYHNLFGIIIMSVCLLLYVFAFFLSRKIMDIEV